MGSRVYVIRTMRIHSFVVWDEDTYLYANKEEALDRFRKLKEKFTILIGMVTRTLDITWKRMPKVIRNVIITFDLGMRET